MTEQGNPRHIDTALGALEGEGAQQKAGTAPPESLQAYEAWSAVPGAATGGATYYDRPVLKEPVWIWTVPAYFYVGGAAGAAVVLGELAESLARGETDGLVRRARWIGAAGGGLGTALLIADLGRPERFLNMLRVLRPTSPMSVGSWVLAAAAPTFAASAILPHAGGVWGRVGNGAGKAAAAFGLPLAGYTSVLLATTAVPLWQEARHHLPYLFVASAAASAASLLNLTELNRTEAKMVQRFGLAGQVGELAAAFALERRVSRIERVGLPLKEGLSGALWKCSSAATLAGLALHALPGNSRRQRVIGGLLGTIGGLALRFGIFHAGKASARDPRATFDHQRGGYPSAER